MLKRRKPLNRGASRLKRTPLKRSGLLAKGKGLARTALKVARPQPAVPALVMADLKGRAGIWCELQEPGVCVGFATDPAHRIGQGVGGRDVLSNLHFACRMCHSWSHGTNNRLEAERLGWILRSTANPLLVPSLYRGVWMLLDDLGGVTPLTSPTTDKEPKL